MGCFDKCTTTAFNYGKFVTMEHSAEELLKLLKESGPKRVRELGARGYHRESLRRFAAKGIILRLERGLYAHPAYEIGMDDPFVQVMDRAPHAVLCLLSALEYHGLTSQQPRELWIALPTGIKAPRMPHISLEVVHIHGNAHLDDLSEVRDGKTAIRVYNLERTIIDCFKYRSRIGLEAALEAIREGVKSKRTTWDMLWKMAAKRKVAKTILPYFEAMR